MELPAGRCGIRRRAGSFFVQHVALVAGILGLRPAILAVDEPLVGVGLVLAGVSAVRESRVRSRLRWV